MSSPRSTPLAGAASPASPRSPTALVRRRVLLGAAAGAALAGAACTGQSAATETPPPTSGAPTLRLLAHGSLTAGSEFKGTRIGGLSGLAFDAPTGLWYALPDDRSRHAPARCYVLRLPAFTPERPLLPEWVDVITLRGPDGKPFARHRVDPEALALRRDAATGQVTLLWASEGDVRMRIPPAVYESALDGKLLRQFKLSGHLTDLSRLTRGPRNNETLEGLTLTPDGRHAWAAMEGALTQDRDNLSPNAPPGPCRITRLDLAAGRADREVAYLPEPRPFGPLIPSGNAESGIAEILMRGAHRMWVLERAWSLSTGVSARLYEADLTDATDTLGMETLVKGRYRAATKRLLLNLKDSGLAHIDNFEAMAWGPPGPNGQPTLVLMTDDNFNPLQVTQFAAFEVSPP